MSEAQQRYLEKINATYAANMAFFKERLPSLYTNLMQANGSARISTRINEGLEVELRFDDQPMPLAELLAVTHDAMQVFDSPDRVCILGRPKQWLPEKLSEEVEDDEFLRNYLLTFHDSHARREIDRHFIHQCGRENALEAPDFGKRVVPILLVFGSGYGSHLFNLLDRYTVKHLIIVDNDPGITKLSLGFTDYIALYNDHLRQKGIHFTLITSSDADDIVTQIDQVLSHFWPPYFIHGISVFHNLRNTEICQKVEQGLRDKLWLVYRGWGWFDDEFISIRHSLANFAKQRKICTLKKPVSEKALAFVVANGPSLDNLVDLIRAHREQAVVVSCGSALGSLHRYGIVPDFHIEMERPYSTYEALKNTVPAEVLSKIRLVGPNTLPPQAFDCVGEALMFMKMADSAGDAAPKEYLRVATFPSVSNAAVSWLLRMGFKRLVLLGTDMGARDPEKHHSAQSLYFHTDDLPEGYQEYTKKEAEKNVTGMTMKAPANFGGTVNTNDFLTMGRLRIEMELAARPGAEVLNLNDGALIKGTTPTRPTDYAFPTDAQDKEQVVADILSNFQRDDSFTASELLSILTQQIRDFIGEISPCIESGPESKLEAWNRLAQLFKAIEGCTSRLSAALWTLRGSSLHLARRIYDYMAAIPDEAQAMAFVDASFGEVRAFLQAVLKELESIDPDAPVPRVRAQDING